MFLLGNNNPIFLCFLGNLKELFEEVNLSEYVTEQILELYREYNAPLPENLVN
jgi:hypothetical protein